MLIVSFGLSGSPARVFLDLKCGGCYLFCPGAPREVWDVWHVKEMHHELCDFRLGQCWAQPVGPESFDKAKYLTACFDAEL